MMMMRSMYPPPSSFLELFFLYTYLRHMEEWRMVKLDVESYADFNGINSGKGRSVASALGSMMKTTAAVGMPEAAGKAVVGGGEEGGEKMEGEGGKDGKTTA